jgi:adenylylsulfate kinase-like enzyme
VTAAWLWLYGPPGVGKSATGYELFEQLSARGDRVAFIEIDQIGMCMPASIDVRTAAKANNLLGTLDNFAAAGVDGVVVSGDIVEAMREVLTRAHEQPVLCRLRADDDITIERLTIRGGLQWKMPSNLYESFGPPSGDLDVITNALSVGEVATEIVRRLGPWPSESAVTDVRAPLGPPAIDVPSAILITGPRAVGTSTVAWQVLTTSIESGRRTGFLDLDQLGFVPVALQEAGLAIKLTNLSTCWAGFRDQGAERLVLCGHADGHDLQVMRERIPSLRIAALTAATETLYERARRRSSQKDVWLPGDDLFGRDDAYLREVTRQAATFDTEHTDVVIETDNRTPAEIAEGITPLWPDTRAS